MGNGQENSGFHYDIEKVSEELHVRTEVLARLVVSFSKTLSDRLVSLEDALNKDDVIKMRAILHEIRGTSGNLRLEGVASTGRVMHEAVKSESDKDKIPEYFKSLKAEADALGNYANTLES